MTENDPFIRQVREQISDNDRAIVEAINARLKLVARLKGYKESRGMNFVDPDREEWMLQYLARANRGPLSSEGLRELMVPHPALELALLHTLTERLRKTNERVLALKLREAPEALRLLDPIPRAHETPPGVQRSMPACRMRSRARMCRAWSR